MENELRAREEVLRDRIRGCFLGGAAGDYYVAHALRSLPDETLCNDTGVAMRFYVKEENHP